jgi:succinyl-CoA synthetase beta subunit
MESTVLTEHAADGAVTLNEYEARNVLREYDIPCPTEVALEYDESKSAADYLEELQGHADAPAFPAYLKVLSRDISSMSDAGGIQEVPGEDAFVDTVEQALDSVQAYDASAAIDGLLISEDVGGETRELFVGATVDPQFGHVVSFGVGGIYVEVYKDVEFRTVPLDRSDAESMLEDIEGSDLLDGFRGMDPVDRDAVIETLLQVSTLLAENPDVTEIDINPLMAGPDGVVAADALLSVDAE